MSTMIKSREHYELMEMFERTSFEHTSKGRLDKEPKELWEKGNIYQDGRTNEQFIAFRAGYAYGIAMGRLE